jgi:membrane protein
VTERVRVTWPAPQASPGRVGVAVGRTLRRSWRAAGQGVLEFYTSNNLTFAASIAYYALVSMFPFLLLVLSLLSRLRVGHADQPLLQVVAGALPRRFEFLVTGVQEFERAPLRLSVAGTLVAVMASMGVFGAITSAINYAWGVEKPHGFFKHKLVAFVMLVAAGVLMGATLLLMSAVQLVHATWFAGVLARLPGLAALKGFVYRNAPTPMFVFVVGLIYYFVPNTRVRLRDVWCGAVLAGLLWRLAFAAFAWYVSDLSRLSVHGSFAAVVAFLLWVYVSAVILLYGAEVSAAYAQLSP